MEELTPDLLANSNLSMYEQLYAYIRDEIRNNNLTRGTKLPSTRVLCKHLEVSRSTVTMAYEQLLSEGYIESVQSKGYYVADIEGLYNVEFHNEPSFEMSEPKEQYDCDFSPSGIDISSFPFNSFRKITKNILVDDNKELFLKGHVQGDYEFRQTISNYLYQSRGVAAKPENVIIGAGNEYLLMFLNQLIRGEKIFAMENPTYQQTYKILKSLGEKIAIIGQDKYGMSVKELAETGANIAYVMPSHQYPLGIVMPMKRRMELLKWANEKENRYIIEDDYDSEFRYRGKPIPALCGFDKYQKVIYIGTFSKSIAPAIRMSYMVLPDSLMEIYKKFNFYSCTVSRMDQSIVRSFMESGHYVKHLNKMRALYKARHDLLLECLEDFKEKFVVSGENAGVHLLLESVEKKTEAELIELAQNVGVRVYPLSKSDISREKTERNTVILGYANISEEDIVSGINKLKNVWL